MCSYFLRKLTLADRIRLESGNPSPKFTLLIYIHLYDPRLIEFGSESVLQWRESTNHLLAWVYFHVDNFPMLECQKVPHVDQIELSRYKPRFSINCDVQE